MSLLPSAGPYLAIPEWVGLTAVAGGAPMIGAAPRGRKA